MPRAKRRNRKGSGQVLRSGKSWGIRYTENGERKYQGGYPDKDKAAQALANITAQIAAGLPGIPPKPKGAAPTFRLVISEWLEARKALRSWRDDKNRWEKHLAPLLSHRQLDRVDTALVDELVTGLKKVLEPAGVERVLYTLSGFYRWAIRRKLAHHNPVREYLAGLERAERKQIRTQHDPKDTPFLKEKDQVAAVFRALPYPVNIAYALSALAGLRPGEAVALQWSDVDLDAAKATVRRTVRHGRVGVPKSGKPRVVPLVPSLVAVLRKAREEHPGKELVAPPLGRGHLGPKTIKEALTAALKASKLPGLSFYEAGRHTFASQWVLAGLDIYRLSEIMGHASVTTTMRYAHLTEKVPDHVLAAADVRLVA